MSNPDTQTQLEEQKRDIIASLANDYYDSLKNEAPYINMKFEEMGAVCRDFATQDVEALIDSARLDEVQRAWRVVGNMPSSETGHYILADLQDRIFQLSEATHTEGKTR